MLKRVAKGVAVVAVVIFGVAVIISAYQVAQEPAPEEPARHAQKQQEEAAEPVKQPAPKQHKAAKPKPKEAADEAGTPASSSKNGSAKTPKPAPKPESLYDQAAAAPVPAYKLDYTSKSGSQRIDAYVVLPETSDKAKLGAVVLDLQGRAGSELTYVTFCTRPGENACAASVYTDAMLATTGRGVGFMRESGVEASGEPPILKIPAY